MIYFEETLVDDSALKFLNENGENYQYRYFTSDQFKIPHNINKNLPEDVVSGFDIFDTPRPHA